MPGKPPRAQANSLHLKGNIDEERNASSHLTHIIWPSSKNFSMRRILQKKTLLDFLDLIDGGWMKEGNMHSTERGSTLKGLVSSSQTSPRVDLLAFRDFVFLNLHKLGSLWCSLNPKYHVFVQSEKKTKKNRTRDHFCL